jgi:hypothetical protein
MNKNIVKVIVIIIILVVFGVIGLIIYLLYRSHKSKSTTSNPSNQQTTFSLSKPSRIYNSNRCLVTDGVNLNFDDCSSITKDNPVALWILLSNGELVNQNFINQEDTICVTPRQDSMFNGTPLMNILCTLRTPSNYIWTISNPTWTIKDNKLVYSNGLCLGSNSSHEAIQTSCHNAPILSNSPIT